LPTIQFFENSCTPDKSLKNDIGALNQFLGTIWPVDSFHFKTHSATDADCHANNNPNRWPVLKTTSGTWRFNGSAAEITNAWYGNFLSICWGMHEVMYRFF
ncbi:hypothetical protein CROQUDRAFT_49430, partial [Cronartium quercuum f. sp. fusiforme G11]